MIYVIIRTLLVLINTAVVLIKQDSRARRSQRLVAMSTV